MNSQQPKSTNLYDQVRSKILSPYNSSFEHGLHIQSESITKLNNNNQNLQGSVRIIENMAASSIIRPKSTTTSPTNKHALGNGNICANFKTLQNKKKSVILNKFEEIKRKGNRPPEIISDDST